MLDTVLSALRGGDFAAAESAARAWLVDQPDTPQAEHLLGVSLQAQGDLSGADAAFARALALAPDRTETHVARALLAAARYDTAAAQAGFDHALTQDPNQLIAYLSLAQLALGRNDLVEADRLLRLAERVNPEHPHLFAMHGQLLMARGQGEQALNVLNEAMRRAPDDGLVQGVMGLILLGLGRHAFAEQALRNALALQPNGTALRHALLRALLAQDRRDEASEEVAVLLRETPDDPGALALQGQLAFGRGDVALARSSFERAMLVRPHAGVLQTLESLLQSTGVLHEFAPMLDQIVAAHPDFEPAWAALLATARGDSLQSAAIAERWYTASPSVYAGELLAQVSEARGDHGRAADLARQVVARDPVRSAAQIVLARAALRDGDAGAAVARLQPLASQVQEPSARRAVFGWLGHAYDRHGDAEAAIAAWREAQTLASSAKPLPSMSVATTLVDTALARAAELAPQAQTAGDDLPVLFWAPPGASAEIAGALLRDAAPMHVASDRFGATPRRDGFALPDGIDLFPATLDAGADEFVAHWRDGVAALGFAPAQTVDWLPNLDRRVLPMLHAAAPTVRALVALRDPRDLLLNWLAFGSPQRYALADLDAAARWLAQTLETVALLREQDLLRVLIVRDGIADGDLGGAAHAIAEFLGLAHAPDVTAAQRLRDGPLALPTRFPNGRWRDYATALRDVFAPLHAVAARLGYAAD